MTHAHILTFCFLKEKNWILKVKSFPYSSLSTQVICFHWTAWSTKALIIHWSQLDDTSAWCITNLLHWLWGYISGSLSSGWCQDNRCYGSWFYCLATLCFVVTAMDQNLASLQQRLHVKVIYCCTAFHINDPVWKQKYQYTFTKT